MHSLSLTVATNKWVKRKAGDWCCFVPCRHAQGCWWKFGKCEQRHTDKHLTPFIHDVSLSEGCHDCQQFLLHFDRMVLCRISLSAHVLHDHAEDQNLHPLHFQLISGIIPQIFTNLKKNIMTSKQIIYLMVYAASSISECGSSPASRLRIWYVHRSRLPLTPNITILPYKRKSQNRSHVMDQMESCFHKYWECLNIYLQF